MTGVSRFMYQPRSANAPASALAEALHEPIAYLREQGSEALKDFERIASRNGRPFERQLVDDEPRGGMALLARYSDLTVVGQMNLDDPCWTGITDLPEYVALGSGRPVLVVPYAGRFEKAGSRILVAWDGSVSATRAVAGALPLMKHADIVKVAVLNPDAKSGTHGEDPGADIAVYLARHGIQVEVVRSHTEGDIGSALLGLADDQSTDLMVMGCYGHTRFHEILLGGVTRSVLQAMTVPVLMSH